MEGSEAITERLTRVKLLDKDFKLLLVFVSIPLYILAMTVSFGGTPNGCPEAQGQDTGVCVTDYITTNLEKEYLGVITLPVEKAGMNIEWLHYLFGAGWLVLSGVTLKEYVHAYT